MQLFNKTIDVEYEGKIYRISIIRKNIKNMYFRYKEDVIVVTAPIFISEEQIKKSLFKLFPKIIKQKPLKEETITKDYIYIFGNKYSIIKSNKTCLSLDTLYYQDDKKLEDYLKNILYEYVLDSYFNYFKIMNIKEEYKISVRKMKTRLGSNSRRTRKLTFSLSLVHFDKEIIDSVVIHELAHDLVFNHSIKFYNIVYKYCPNIKY